MKNLKKFVLISSFIFALILVSVPGSARAATGEGTATINGSTTASVSISTSNVLTVVLTVGASGIAIDASNPTFTIPTGFTAPHAAGGASVPTNAGQVDVDGEWFVSGAGGTCAVTMASSSATGQVISVDVTGACASTNTLTLTYKGTAPATAAAAANFDVKTDDVTGGGAAASITTTPAHTIVVKGTAVVANHATAGVATTNNLAGLAGIGGTDIVLGGFKITAAGENVSVTTIRTSVTLGTMVIGELTNLRIVPDDGTTAGSADDGVMNAGELATPLATIASPIEGSNDFTVTDTVTSGSSKNYFLVGTIASTVSDADTIDVEGTGAGSVAAGVTSVVAITATGTSTNSTRTISDTTAPTLAITLGDNYLTKGETMPVTFTFSEAPTGFTSADVTVENGTLGTIDATDPLVQTAVFTPSTNMIDTSNVVTVGTSWSDSSAALNAPAGTTTSLNYTIHNISSGGGGGGGGGSSSSSSSSSSTVVVCTAGQKYSTENGKPCTTTLSSTAVVCLVGEKYSTVSGLPCTTTVVVTTPGNGNSPVVKVYLFGTGLVKLGSKGEACKAWQMFLNDHMVAGLTLDGNCGKMTIGAAKKWQASAGLSADGVLGAKSRAKAEASM